MISKIFGPIDIRLHTLSQLDMTVLASEVFAFVPSKWHGEYIRVDKLIPYIHPDIISNEGIERLKDLGAIKVSTPLLGVDFYSHLGDALIDGIPFDHAKEKVNDLYNCISYVELLTAKFLSSREQYFAHVFDNIDDRTVFTKYISKKRVKINIKEYLDILKSGRVPRKKGYAKLEVDSNVVIDWMKVRNICNEIYV